MPHCPCVRSDHRAFGALGTTAVRCVSSVLQPAILAPDLGDLACTPDRELSCQQPHRFLRSSCCRRIRFAIKRNLRRVPHVLTVSTPLSHPRLHILLHRLRDPLRPGPLPSIDPLLSSAKVIVVLSDAKSSRFLPKCNYVELRVDQRKSHRNAPLLAHLEPGPDP